MPNKQAKHIHKQDVDSMLARQHNTLPLRPVILRFPNLAATSLTTFDFSGCCQAHSNCSAWICIAKLRVRDFFRG